MDKNQKVLIRSGSIIFNFSKNQYNFRYKVTLSKELAIGIWQFRWLIYSNVTC